MQHFSFFVYACCSKTAMIASDKLFASYVGISELGMEKDKKLRR